MFPALHYQVTDGLQGERAKGGCPSMPVEMNDGTEGKPVFVDFGSVRAVRAAIVLLGMTHKGENKLIDAQVRHLGIVCRKASPGGLPFGDDAGVLLPAGSGAVLA